MYLIEYVTLGNDTNIDDEDASMGSQYDDYLIGELY